MLVLFSPMIGIIVLVAGAMLIGLRSGALSRAVPNVAVLEKQRLLQQLAELDEGQAADLMDPATRIDEKARLESALARLLESNDATISMPGAGQAGSGNRLVSILLVVTLAIALPAAGVGLYLYMRLPFLSDLSDNDGHLPMVAQRPAMNVDQIEAMVARLAERLESAPDDGAGWKRLGRSYWVLGQTNLALDAYVQADRRLANDPDVILGLEQIAQASGAADSGEEQLVRVQQELIQLAESMESRPEGLDGWLQLARWQAATGELDQARDSYAVAHALVPEQADVLGRYAAASFAANPKPGNAETLSLYRQLDRLDPRNPDAHWYLGLWRYGQQDYPAAIARWQSLLALMPDEDPARVTIEKAIAAAGEGIQKLE